MLSTKNWQGKKIGVDVTKFIRGVAQKDLKKGDGSMVTLFNNIVEQKNHETSLFPIWRNLRLDGLHVTNMPLEEPSKKDGILNATTLFDEHGLDIKCPSLEQQKVAKINCNVASIGGIETILELTLKPYGFVAYGLGDLSSWKVVVKILGKPSQLNSPPNFNKNLFGIENECKEAFASRCLEVQWEVQMACHPPPPLPFMKQIPTLFLLLSYLLRHYDLEKYTINIFNSRLA